MGSEQQKRQADYSLASFTKIHIFSKTGIFLSKYNKHFPVNIFTAKIMQYLFKYQTHIYYVEMLFHNMATSESG